MEYHDDIDILLDEEDDTCQVTTRTNWRGLFIWFLLGMLCVGIAAGLFVIPIVGYIIVDRFLIDQGMTWIVAVMIAYSIWYILVLVMIGVQLRIMLGDVHDAPEEGKGDEEGDNDRERRELA